MLDDEMHRGFVGAANHQLCIPLQGEITQFRTLKIAHSDQFAFTDLVDGSVTERQGARFIMDDGSRFVFRLSGASAFHWSHPGTSVSMPA